MIAVFIIVTPMIDLIYVTSMPNAYRVIITLPGMKTRKENLNWGRNNNKRKSKQKRHTIYLFLTKSSRILCTVG